MPSHSHPSVFRRRSRRGLLTLAVLLAVTLVVPALRAQSVVITSYADDFQSYGTQKNPAGWVDTAIGSSTPTAGGLYKTWPDPTQSKGGTNVVFGTKQASGKPEGNNPRIGTFSTYVDKTFNAAGRFEYKGRFLRTTTDARVGLTFLSSYPQTDRYYLLGLWSHPSGNLTMQLFGFGGGTPAGTTVSDFSPLPGKWYDFLIRVDDVGGKTSIRARFWLDTNPEPSTWNIDAVDAGAGRLTSGRIGIWSAVRGEVYVDDLAAKSPVDHTPPTIEFFADDKPLVDGLKFNHAITPKIVVTDDLSGAQWTATLDGAAYTAGTPITGQGDHVLTVDAVDGVGNRVSKSVHFYIDTLPPVLTIVKPANGSMTADDVLVALNVVDASLPYTASATLDAQPFDLRNPITTEGAHTLTVIVTDAVGLQSVPVTTQFTIDRSAPTYELFANGNPLAANAPVFDRDVVLTITTHDLTPVTVTLILDEGSYQAGTPITDERKHTIRGTITDSVGHTTTIAPLSFWIDKSAPVVTLLGNDEPLKDLYDLASLVLKVQVDDITPVRITATLNTQPFTSPSTLTEEKEYSVSGTVTDAANHTTPFGPRTFAIDRSNPEIILRANGQPFPASGHIFLDDVDVTLEVRDLTLREVTATLDGAPVATFPLHLGDEFYRHDIKVVAADKLNHTSTVGPIEFSIDKLAPIVTVTNDKGTEIENETYFKAAVTPLINVVDISHTTIDAKLNGQSFQSGTPVTADGTYVLTGTVTDEAQRQTPIGPLTFTIDTIAPAGVFMEGENNPFPDGKSLNVDAVRAWVKITDANPLPATILLDGEPYTERDPITSENAHTLTATLRDKAGNTGVVPPVTFRIDRTPPSLTLFAFGDLFPARPIETHLDVPVTFDAQDPSRPITVTGTLDGQEIALPYTITAEGEHTLSGKAIDAAGNVGTAGPYTIKLEKTPPNVEVLLNGEVAGIENVYNVPVSITLRVSSGITSRTNSILLNNSAYVEGTAVTGEGEYVITGTVTTGSGLVVPIPETPFTIDTTPPDVTLKNRDVAFEANGFHYNSDVVPNAACTDNLTRGTVELTVDGNAWNNGEPITEEAPHVVVAAAVDRAGNRKELPPVDFVIDKTPPALTIVAPTEGQVLSVANVIVRGASDDAITVTVNGTPATIDHDAKTYATPSLSLAEGENELTVEGVDLAGNPAAPKSVKVVVDTRAPGLGNIQPPPNACLAGSDVTVTGSVTDPSITTVKVSLDDRVVANALDAQKGSFTAPFTSVAEGVHRITIEATDSLGHRTVNALQIVVDRSVPVIDVLEGGTPLSRNLFNRPVALTFRARDIDPNVQLSVTLGGTPFANGTALTAQGAYHFDALARDCAGNQFVLPVDVTIDLTAPLFDTLTPAAGSTVGSIPSAITGHVSSDAVEVAIDNTTISVHPDAQGNFALPGTFTDGANTFVLRATDAAGNVTRLPYAFTVRSGAPSIQILESGEPLADNALFNRPVRPTVQVSDPSARLLVLINGQTDNGEPLTADGTYTIVATAEDDLQRSASESRTFTIDRTPPVITIQSPQPGVSATSTVDLAGTADDAVSVNVHGTAMTPDAGGAFRRNGVTLDLGDNELLVSGTDRAGNTGYDSVVVTWRGDGPAILITQPADNSLTNRPRVDVAGRVLAPLSGGQVIVGSKTVTLDATGAFRATDYQLVDGPNEIVAQLPDGPRAVVHVTADFTPPTLAVLVSGQPLEENAKFPAAITITVNASDDRELDVTRFTVDGTEGTSPFNVSATGGHVLSAIARDKAGNETRIERTFFIGATSTAGGCSIDAFDPANNSTIAPSSNANVVSVRVTGRAPGATAVTVGSVSADVADGTFAATIELPNEGANAIDIRCKDASGTLSDPSHVTYYRVSGMPTVHITSPVEGDVTADTTITVRGEVGADVVQADVNGVHATITEGNPRTFVAENITLARGVNVLVAHARNGAYRYGSHSVRVRSEQAQPVIRITQPQTNAIAGGLKATVSGTYANVRPNTLAIAGGADAPSVQTVALSDTTGIFVFRNVAVVAGPQTLTVSGRNEVNVSASASVVVNGDANAPGVAITEPLDNAWLAAEDTIAVRGTFVNPSGTPRVDVNGESATVDASALTYSGSTQHSTTSPLTPVSARLLANDGTGPAANVTVHKLAGPLRIVNTFPEDATEGVDPAAIVLINFSAPLDRATLGGIHLTKNGASVDGSIRVEDTIVVFTPSTLLESGAAYRVEVPLTVKDVAGHSLAEAASFGFTTLASAPSVPPSVDPVTITGCPSTVDIHGTAPAFARLLLETGTTVPFDGLADASGHFTMRFPLSGRSGYQSGRLYVVAADGSRSPAAPVSFRIDCAGPQVVGASFDRDGNVVTIVFSKNVDPATVTVGPSSSIVLDVSDGSSPSGSVTVSGASVTIVPADDLRAKSFTLEIATTITDTTGNALVVPFTQNFSAGGDEQPIPGDGSGFVSGEVYDATTGRPLANVTVASAVPESAFARVPSVTSNATSTGNSARYTIVGTPSRPGKVAATTTEIEVSRTTDDRGRYVFSLPEGAHTIEAGARDYTTVWRQIVVPAGAGVIPIDIRMQRRGAQTSAATLPITLQDGGGARSVTVPIKLTVTGGVAADAKVAATSVGAQSLAGLLPLGWSPIASAEIAVFGADNNLVAGAPLTADLEFTLPSADIAAAQQTLSFVQYDSERDEWRTLVPAMTAASGDTWRVAVHNAGAYAVVYRDLAAGLQQPPAAVAGATLQAAARSCDPCTLTRKGFDIVPPMVSPSEKAVATLQIEGEDANTYPSGTAVQAYVSEVLHLSDGGTVVDPPFTADVLLYRGLDGKTGLAEFVIAPSQTARSRVLESGVDQVRILHYPGRLDRGSLIGSEGGRVPGDDTLSLEIPSGATTEQLHATVAAVPQSELNLTIDGFDVVGGFTFTLTRAQEPPAIDADNDGVPDAPPAIELSRAARATMAVDTTKLASPNAQLVLVEVVPDSEWGSFYRLATPMIRLDAPQDGVTTLRYTTRTIDSELPIDGVVHAGRYLVLAAKAPIGIATGVISSQQSGPAIVGARITSAMPAGNAYGVFDVTRPSGIFAVPIAAQPATTFTLTPREPRLGIGRTYSATAPAPDAIVHVDGWVFDVQPLHLVGHTPQNNDVVPAAAIEIAAEFDLAIDPASLGDAIRVTNTDGGIPLGGAATLDPSNPKIIKWTSTGQVVAGATYTVTLQATIRATNGARFNSPTTFDIRTAPLPRDGTVRPELIHITMPTADGHSRLYGTAGAIPPTWRVNVLRPGRGFRTTYDSDVAADGSFSIDIGGGDPYDRITIDDLIDLQVLNFARNVAVTLRMPAFVTEDGLGFVARPESESTFTSAEGVKLVVAAGTFDKATLVTTKLSTSPEAFAEVPNFANEIRFHRAITINFDGVAQKKIEVSLPINGLPTDEDYILGYADESSRGPRVSIASLMRVEGDQFTTYFPPQGGTSGARRVGSTSNMSFPTASSLMSCMPGVMVTGTYALMQLTPPGGGLIGWATVDTMRTLDVFNSIFTSIFLPGYRFFSRGCATVPVVAGRPFTLVGVDPTSGTEVFSHTYPGIEDPTTVVALPNPNPDRVGPYPIYATPFRVEQIDAPPLADTNGDNIPDTGFLITRGMQVKLNQSGDLEITKAPYAPAAYILPPKTKIQFYDLTKSLHSNIATVSATGSFQLQKSGVEAGDQLYVFLSAPDVGPETIVSVVFSEPIDVGTIPPGATDTQQKQLIDQHLHGVIKFEQVTDSGTIDLTAQVTFEAVSENRRVKVNLPAELARGAIYRLTMKSNLQDPEGNRLAERKKPDNSVYGEDATDISMDFVVRPGPDVQNEFNLRPNDTFSGAGLRDMAKYGNLVFVAASGGGLLAYDMAEPSSLKSGGPTGEPKPIAVVPGGWTSSGSFVDGVSPMWEFWSVAVDQHGRVYGGGFGGGFEGQFSLIRSYRVEDFLDARDNGSNCGATIGDNLNCRRYGTAIVGWRPGSYMGSQVGVTFGTNQPTAYVRKLKLLEQDDNLTSAGGPTAPRTFGDLTTIGVPGVEVVSNVAAGPGSEFHRATLRVDFGGSTSSGGEAYLIQRVTVINTTLDMRWHADVYQGESADIKNVIARDKDTIVVLRNRTTYAVATLFGYGAAVYDMNAVETNGVLARCTDSAFRGAHLGVCATALLTTKLPEKVVVTNADEKTTCDGIGYDEGDTMRYAPEVFGIVRTNTNLSTGATTSVSPDMTLLAITGAKGTVMDMRFALPSGADPQTASCATVGGETSPTDAPWMSEISTVNSRTQRLTNGAIYHWEVTKEQNVKGLRGSVPNTAISRDYLLVAGNDWGLVIYEIGGTTPPNAPGYWTLTGAHVVDTIWIAAGAQAVSVIEGTDLAAVIDRKGRLLIVDLSTIDERWGPVPAPPPDLPASFNGDPFKLPTNAMNTPTTVAGEKGVNDPRVIYQSKDAFAFGVMPPIVSADTGIAFGGEITGAKMRVRPVLDPKIDFLIDAGNGLQPTGKIIPLGLPYPTSVATTAPAGALGAFRVRVTLPGAITKALPGGKLHMAIESELVAGGIAPQTPRSLPRAHLRLNDRTGTVDKRKLDFTLTRTLPDILTQEKEFRHQRGYNKLISPWIVAIADPRASEKVLDAQQADGCTQCKRPSALVGKTETDGVYEMYTNGRFVSARIDGNTDNVLPADSLPDFYDYLAEKSRFQARVATVIADTARPKSTMVPAQAPPIAQGTLDGTVYVHSGELQVGSSDMTLLGRGTANLELTRSYRSSIIGGSLLGLGWEASFLRRLRELPNGDVEYRDGAGDIWVFKLPKSGPGSAAPPALNGLESTIGTRIRYDAPKGLFYSLMRTDDGWTLLDSKWRVTRFDNLGRLSAESDEFWKPDDFGASQNGNLFRYFYDADGRLGQIVDPMSRVTTISYYPEGVTNTDCTSLGSKTTPCAYAGLLKEISDWRGRSILFEYDRVGRLIGVQMPKVDAVSGAPSDYDFSSDTKRPRVSYEYAGGDTYPDETATDQVFTDFMQYAANLESITDASGESSSQKRVTYDWYETNEPDTRDRLHHVKWPCGSYVSSCSAKEAKVEYAGASTKITDLMDQKWEYTTIDVPETGKHLDTVTALEVPTFNAESGVAPDLIPNNPNQSLTTKYTNYDPETGIPLTTTLPSGRTIDYTVKAPPSNKNAQCKQVTKVSEAGSGASRDTTINYDDKPNALCTVSSMQQGPDKRERESAHRDRLTTTVDVDTKAGTQTETLFDKYGRPTDISQKDSGGSAVIGTKVDYKNNTGDQIGWQRVAAVHDASNETNQTYEYFKDGAGQRIVVTDTKRNTTTTTRYNALDQLIYREVKDASYGQLSEQFMAYDADGRLAWMRRTAPGGGSQDVTMKYDAMGRVTSTVTSGNHVDGNPNVSLEVKQTYDLGSKQLITTDPTTVGGTAPAQHTTTVDNLGRTTRTEYSGGGKSLVQAYAYDAHNQLSYQSDTLRHATAIVRDGLGRETESISHDGVARKLTYSTWDQPSENSVVAGGITVSHSKQFFTDEGRLLAINEEVDGTYRQTLFSWKNGATEELVRVAQTSSLDAKEPSPGVQVRATRTKVDAVGRVTDVTTGASDASADDITDAYHTTSYTDFRGTEPRTIVDTEPKRSTSVTHTQELDGLDRVRTSTVAGQYETRMTYDVAGNLSDVVPTGLGNTHTDFDARGLPYHTEKPGAQNLIDRKYDALGVLREIKDEAGAVVRDVTTYDTDALGRVTVIHYPDFPQTTEEFRYEDVSGVLIAEKDRKGQWISYAYDDGGRITQVHDGPDPTSGAIIQAIEYDAAKRVKRIANKDAAVEFADYDLLGRPKTTRRIRYEGGSGVNDDASTRILSDAHTQTHTYSMFDGERESYHMPIAGTTAGGANGGAWRDEIIEHRDAGSNLIEHRAGSSIIATATGAGIARITEQTRTTGTGSLQTTYGFADIASGGLGSGDPSVGASGTLIEAVTKRGTTTIAGTRTYPDQSLRVRDAVDLGLGRTSKWTYDGRGRLTNGILLAPSDQVETTPGITDVLTGADFRSDRQLLPLLTASQHADIGLPLARELEPLDWHADEQVGHQIDKRTIHFDATDIERDYSFEGGRRVTDSVWTSTYDAFGHLTAIESATKGRRIEYTYGPDDRVVGRKAIELATGGVETRADVLAADGLPAESTFVWDPVSDRLVAIYKAGESMTGSPSAPPPADAGLVRQYIHGDGGYDDAVEVLVASTPGGTVKRYLPIFDEAGTGSLQAVVDGDGNLVERVLYGDSYGDVPKYLHGAVAEKVSYSAKRNSLGEITEVQVHVRVSENVDSSTVAAGYRLAAIDDDNNVLNTYAIPPDFITSDDHHEVRWTLTALQWESFTSNPATSGIEVAVKSSLRTEVWGDQPVQEVPAWAQKIFSATVANDAPVVVRASLSTLDTAPTNGDPISLYSLDNLYLAASPESAAHLLTGFKASPFVEPATGLAYFRARWYDPATGTWLTPDPMGYQDSSNLYAFAAADPVNLTDPMGEALGDWWDPRSYWEGGFFGETGHDLWNVASLGTLERVEQQKNLGTWGGLGESTFNGLRSVSNTASFGLQDAIYETQMREGPGLRSIGMGVSKAAYDLLPMEEVRALVQDGDQLDTADKIRLVFTGISKTASVLAGAKAIGEAGAVRYYRARVSTVYRQAIEDFSKKPGLTNSDIGTLADEATKRWATRHLPDFEQIFDPESGRTYPGSRRGARPDVLLPDYLEGIEFKKTLATALRRRLQFEKFIDLFPEYNIEYVLGDGGAHQPTGTPIIKKVYPRSLAATAFRLKKRH